MSWKTNIQSGGGVGEFNVHRSVLRGTIAGGIGALLAVGVLLLAGMLITGCSVIDTGPQVAQAAVEGATGMGRVLIQQFEPESMTAGAKANVNDPRYRVRIFVGAGTLVDLLMSLEGAEANFEVKGAGRGVPIDQALKADLTQIMGSGQLSKQERERLITEAALRFVDRLMPQQAVFDNLQPPGPAGAGGDANPPGAAGDGLEIEEQPGDQGDAVP